MKSVDWESLQSGDKIILHWDNRWLSDTVQLSPGDQSLSSILLLENHGPYMYAKDAKIYRDNKETKTFLLLKKITPE